MSLRNALGLLFSVLLAGCPATPVEPSGDAGADAAAGDAAPAIDGAVDAGLCLCTSDADCDDGTYCNGAETCGSCVCHAGTAPCAAASCHEASASCDCATPDGDGDGSRSVACGGTDCDDANPNRFPGHTEVCDVGAVDEDCDPTTFGFRDADGDGFADGACCNHEGTDACGTDCSDTSPGVHPTAPEVCNGFDDDCDTATDEGVIVTTCADCDGDGHGVPAGTATTLCGRAPMMTGCSIPMGYATTCNDCDETSTDVFGTHPELCDGIDNDCNGVIDDGVVPQSWYVDCDGDGFAAAGATAMTSCSRPSMPPSCSAPVGTCAPTLVPSWTLTAPAGSAIDCDDVHTSVRPGAAEACDGFDTDCDGHFGTMPAEDADGDGYPAASCGPCGSDCLDMNPAAHPTATEIPGDGIDENCDGSELCYTDVDLDGFGGVATVSTADFMCTMSGHERTSSDCCDSDARAFPGQELWFNMRNGCTSWDYDCSGVDDLQWPVCTVGCDPSMAGCVYTGPAGGFWCARALPGCGEYSFMPTGCAVAGPGSCETLGSDNQQLCH
jgi:hypothetical protein